MDLEGVSAKVGSPHKTSKGVARTANDQLLKCLKQEDWLGSVAQVFETKRLAGDQLVKCLQTRRLAEISCSSV